MLGGIQQGGHCGQSGERARVLWEMKSDRQGGGPGCPGLSRCPHSRAGGRVQEALREAWLSNLGSILELAKPDSPSTPSSSTEEAPARTCPGLQAAVKLAGRI